MEKRFGALRIIGSIFRILGWLVIIAAVIIGGYMMVNSIGDSGGFMRPGMAAGIWGGLTVLFYGGLGGLVLVGFGEVIYLLISIEENTRASAILLNSPREETVVRERRVEPVD